VRFPDAPERGTHAVGRCAIAHGGSSDVLGSDRVAIESAPDLDESPPMMIESATNATVNRASVKGARSIARDRSSTAIDVRPDAVEGLPQ
jgi:hypothetical protein